MATSIETVCDELRADHRNMVLLLDLLAAETDRGEPDYELLNSIMTYMAEYPDAVHHPREDRLYHHLQEQHPEIDASLQQVETDHAALEAEGTQLLDQLKALSAGGGDPTALIAGLRTYAAHLRAHMYWEEQTLFALADELDPQQTLSSDTQGADPLFGKRADRRFRRLLNRIQRHMVWDAQQYLG